MAGLGSLVEARFPPPDRVGDPDAVTDEWLPMANYDGPPCALAIEQHEDLRAIRITGAPAGGLQLPLGTLDSIDDRGAYRRFADGIRSSDESAIGIEVRLVGTSLRTSGRSLSIHVDGGPFYEVRRSVFRGTRLERDGVLVAKGFRGKVIEVSSAATPLDAVLVSAVWAVLWRMLALPKLPDFEIPGD